MAIGDQVVETLSIDGTDQLQTNTDGCVAHSSLSGSRDWLVHAPGYCACVVTGPRPGGVVLLDPASELRIEAIGEDGNPVANAQLQLRCKGSPALLDGLECRIGVGDPRSETPAWVATTDGRGQAVFDTIPVGTFFLQALHASTYCQTPEGHAGRPVVAPGRITLEMKDLFAMCAVPLPGQRVRSYAWSLSPRVDVGQAVQKGRVFARRALQRRWPEALVHVSRPMEHWLGEPLPLVCRAVLESGTAAEVAWPLTRIRELGEPVVLEPRPETVLRDVRIHVFEASGQPLAMRLVLARDVPGEDPVIQDIRTGDSVLLTPGTYVVKPEMMPLWLNRLFGDCKVEVRSTDPLEVRKDIVLDEPLRLVVITPDVAPGVLPSGRVIHFLVKSVTADSSMGVMNWEPARGPIEILLPPGRVRIDVQGAVHQTNVGSLDVVPGTGPQEVALKIQASTEQPDPERLERHRAR